MTPYKYIYIIKYIISLNKTPWWWQYDDEIILFIIIFIIQEVNLIRR